jgi:hypothetical protein
VASSVEEFSHHVAAAGAFADYPADCLIVGVLEGGTVWWAATLTEWPDGHLTTIRAALATYRARRRPVAPVAVPPPPAPPPLVLTRTTAPAPAPYGLTPYGMAPSSAPIQYAPPPVLLAPPPLRFAPRGPRFAAPRGGC